MSKESSADTRPLLARIMDTPQLERLVPGLQPALLHRIVERVGIEECGALLALATAEQLTEVMDLDLWRREQPGVDESLDAGRFGRWLEALVDSGTDAAARTVARMDADVVTAALAQHIAVFDPATLDGAAQDDSATGDRRAEVQAEIGGYVIAARRLDSWDPIVDVLATLDSAEPDFFHRVMTGCRRLSNSAPEVDGLDDLLMAPEQVLYDLAAARDRRREQQGYASPADARAFLSDCRRLSLDAPYPPALSPIAAAYFRSLDDVEVSDDRPTARSHRPDDRDVPDEIDEGWGRNALLDILASDGRMTSGPRALLGSAPGEATGPSLLEQHINTAANIAPAAAGDRERELAFLANVLMAGSSVQDRAFTVQEAFDAAAAVCSLGLENWPRRWLTPGSDGAGVSYQPASLPDAFLVDHDLVSVFQVGWNVLHHQVCMDTARQFLTVLGRLTSRDRDIQADLTGLGARLAAACRSGTPWTARHALDVLTSLDMPAWAGLLGLLGECPVLHGAVRASLAGAPRVHPSAFEFISSNAQIASARSFVASLESRLRD